jgi:hypothetical protein
MNTTTTYKDADAAWMAGSEWILTSDKWEKMDFLMETASPEFKDNLINELLKFMSEFEVAEFFSHLRRNCGVLTKPELEYKMNS